MMGPRMSDDTRDRDDPAHQTMPPELRPFAKPEPQQRLVAPEGEARFNAAVGALKLLNGGPAADPFYVDPDNDPALTDRKAPGSMKAYVPPTVVPAAEAKVRQAAPAKVVISEASQAPPGEKPEETPASPWATETPPAPVEDARLPSSLRPPEPRSGEPAASPAPPARAAVVVLVAIGIAAAIIGLRALVTRGSPESASHDAPRTTTPAPATPVPSAAAPTPTEGRARAPVACRDGDPARPRPVRGHARKGARSGSAASCPETGAGPGPVARRPTTETA
jgi:hypothetical protein